MPGFLEGLFSGQPSTVFDAYANTSNALNKLRGQKIANALSQIKLNFAPQMAQQAADIGTADVSIEQNKAKYAPLLSSLTAQQKQIENAMNSEKFKEMPATFQADMALKHQQIEKIKQDIQLAPQKLANITQKTQWYTSPQYNLPKQVGLQKGAAKSAFLANNQADINNLTVGTLHQALKAMHQPESNGSSSASPPMGAGIVPPGAANAPDESQQAQVAPQQAAQQAPEVPPSAQQQSINQQQFANQVAANKASVSAYNTKRLDNSIEIEKFLQDPKIDLYAAAAAKYSGIAGKGKAALEAWKKNNPEDYEQNIFFRNALKSALVNMNKNLEGLSVHVSQRKELTDNLMQAFDQYSSNPQRAWDQWQRAKQTFHDISKANSAAAQPIYPGVREKAAGLNYDDHEDLNRMVDVKVNGRRASIPLKNLHAALGRPGVEMDLGD